MQAKSLGFYHNVLAIPQPRRLCPGDRASDPNDSKHPAKPDGCAKAFSAEYFSEADRERMTVR